MKYVTLLFLLPIYLSCSEKPGVYADFVIHNDTLWRLDFGGHVFPVNLKTGNEIFHPLLNWHEAIAITCDNTNRLIICDKNNTIIRYNLPENNWDLMDTCSGIVTGITCDAQNNIYVITKSGIVDLCTHQTYAIALPWNRPPQYIMDQEDNIWLGFNIEGRRGDVYIFDTKDKTFYVPDLDDLDMAHRPIISLFKGSSSNDVYGTSQYINGNVVTNSVIQFHKRTGRVLADTKGDAKLKTGAFYEDHIFVGNNLGEIARLRKDKWKIIVPAGNKIIDKIYADDKQLIYLTRDGNIHYKKL